MDVQQEMRNLQELHESGAITDAEYEQRKAQLLNYPPVGAVGPPPQPAYAGADQETRQWAMILHLSQYGEMKNTSSPARTTEYCAYTPSS